VDVTKPYGERVEIKSMSDGKPFDTNKTFKVAVNSYRGNGGGELLTKGAGIPADQLSSRIIYSTDRDLRYYLTDYIKEKKVLKPRKLNQWKFVPEKLVAPAAARDRKALFPDEK
jgi:2',3'-cyclic-nucleotide 2'-phosphodiesterase/3'-nucleotidase